MIIMMVQITTLYLMLMILAIRTMKGNTEKKVYVNTPCIYVFSRNYLLPFNTSFNNSIFDHFVKYA